jgi:hypothetical protein
VSIAPNKALQRTAATVIDLPGLGVSAVAAAAELWRSAGETGLNMIAYWIKSPFPHAPLGFGVTAWSVDDALEIVRALEFGSYLPADLNGVQITEGITVAELDQSHVVTNMGPISVRGLWYPFVAVGLPQWAEERRTMRCSGPRQPVLVCQGL